MRLESATRTLTASAAAAGDGLIKESPNFCQMDRFRELNRLSYKATAYKI